MQSPSKQHKYLEPFQAIADSRRQTFPLPRLTPRLVLHRIVLHRRGGACPQLRLLLDSPTLLHLHKQAHNTTTLGFRM
jgi:hypothetical protein